MSTTTRKLLIGSFIAIFGLAWLNYTVYWIVGVCLGGFANIGRVENGKYFLGSHGRYSEVSETVFTYSRIHGESTLITHGLMFASVLLLLIFRKHLKSP
jgi:hypothetical protein